ncbi:Opaque-phase-specific protein OP4, partial [Candida maltosa Xu316]
MKFSSATILAILASSACVSAAPAIVAEQTMVKREDVNEVLNLIAEIKKINAKRDYAEGEDLLDLERRADSAIGELISALANSGIISLVWNKLTTDSGISSAISAIIKSAIQTAVVQGPALIQAVWNSGLLGDVFNLLLNDTDLRQALLDVAKSIFSTAANLVASWVSGGSSSSSGTTTAAAAAPAASGASKREIMELDAEYLSERDLSSIISWIVQEIKDSGIVQSLVNQVINNPEQVISFLTSAFQTGLVVAEDIYSWAKQAGLWDSALSYIEANAGSWAGAIASFLGNALANGSVSASEIDNAGTLSNTATTVAPITTAAPLAAASPATTTA